MNLRHWADSFALKLCAFHIGHIKTYESDRQREASLQVVNAEVSTLLSLLDSAGVGGEIEKRYRPLRKPDELSPEERAALPERVRKYIEKLESELQSTTTESGRTADRLRKPIGPGGEPDPFCSFCSDGDVKKAEGLLQAMTRQQIGTLVQLLQGWPYASARSIQA